MSKVKNKNESNPHLKPPYKTYTHTPPKNPTRKQQQKTQTSFPIWFGFSVNFYFKM